MNDILQSFVTGQARKDQLKQQQIQNELAQQTQDQANDYHQSLIEDAQTQLEETKKQNAHHVKIAQALHDQGLGALQASLADSVQKGQTIPGATMLDSGVDASTGHKWNRWQLPAYANDPNGKPTVVQLMDPEDYAKRQAEYARIAEAPKVEAKIAEEVGKQQAIGDKQKEIDDRQNVFKSQQQLDHDNVLKRMNDDRIKNAMNVSKVHAGATLGAASIHARATTDAAKIRTGADLFGTAGEEGKVDPSPYITALRDGRMTQEQFDNQFKGTPIAGNYLKRTAFESAGIVAITNKQQVNLGSYQQLYALLPKLNQLATNSALKPWENYELSKELNAEIAKVANGLGGDRGQRLQKMLIDKASGFIPSMVTPTGMAKARVANFERVLKETFKDDFSTQSESQRKALWNQVSPPQLPALKSPTEGLPNN